MAKILRNKYYFYTIKELQGGICLRKRKQKQYPDIKLVNDGIFWKYSINICGNEEWFYMKKNSLKKYELCAAYYETFGDYNFNGHCYIRPEMKVKHNDIVVDAGGCEGYYSRYALSKGAAKVIIFEPCPELAEGLKRTFKDEIDLGRVIVVEKALGKEDHKDTLYINRDMFCAAKVDNLGETYDIERDIFVSKLDDVLKEIGITHIDILKMDIEGAEIDAVIGAKNIIRKCHPKLIIATYHSYYNSIRIRNICKKLNSKYKCNMYGCYQYKIPWRPYITFLS